MGRRYAADNRKHNDLTLALECGLALPAPATFLGMFCCRECHTLPRTHTRAIDVLVTVGSVGVQNPLRTLCKF